ncbi:MAG: biotin--[acetyl-CoA-carboxylase] ligase [Ardenticatenaceae bacterium]|nr:biotin--[acetyl-CoA-carboxylase] ligase [Anaerolineales bacterium]MCB8920790.1 biotin--[acetyl-CoA-carboxylase] ligase [Ardenticatenaceae bacterium]MCB8989749.1 biotin--[acetyl-CoA-carboxylase] ligase [Ardenticatenaceae bacterium]MCB9002792.1 biotin--[acetyl-CoA-carboxylase] ligase [Ardenticatenaceae bacterium]
MQDLQETAVQSALTTHWLGRAYHYVPTIGSTNETLKQMAADGDETAAPAGTVLLADYQSQGRGRLQRRWEATPGTALLFSVLLRPQWPATQANWLLMIASLAVVRAIAAVCPALTVGIKWPNDIMVQQMGEWRKVGGLLLESEMDGNGRISTAILGMGLNVNLTAAQLPQAATPPTSLLLAGGQPVSRQALFTVLLAELEALYETAVSGQSPLSAWRAQLITIGQQVEVTEVGNGRSLYGMATGTDEWGHLQVTNAAGQVYTITAGDVTLRPSI